MKMSKQWNFIFENKLITVYAKDKERAEQKALAIYEDLQKSAS